MPKAQVPDGEENCIAREIFMLSALRPASKRARFAGAVTSGDGRGIERYALVNGRSGGDDRCEPSKGREAWSL